MIFYEPRYGLGNIIQATPAVLHLARQHGGIDRITIVESPETSPFVRAVFRGWRIGSGPATHSSVNPVSFRRLGGISEVASNLIAVGAEATPHQRLGFCGYAPQHERFDIVFANGCNRLVSATDWEAKTYAGWPEVVAMLAALPSGPTMATVGLPDEWIPGTVDRTGIGLPETLGLVRNAGLFASNDTGLYHAAAALEVPAVALFTFTDTDKNYDPVFHRRTRIITTGMDCQPCQLTSTGHWLKLQPLCGWACRDIPSKAVFDAINSVMADALDVTTAGGRKLDGSN